MSRFGRIRRRPDHWRSAHDRARVRAAERLDGPLGLTEAAWLDEHLATCPACATVAASYASERQLLRGLRADPPEPPRDLWARTSAAIELESVGGGAGRDRSTPRRGSRLPMGALAGIAVIALVVGVSTLSGGVFRWGMPNAAPAQQPEPSDVAVAASPDGAPSAAEATPMAVGAGDVAWVDSGPGGAIDYSAVMVEEVCPAKVSGCPLVGDDQRSTLGLTSAPRTIFGSPTRGQAIAISDNGAAGDQLVIVQLPGSDPTPEPTTTPAATPAQTPDPSDPPIATTSPGSPPPSPDGTATPTPTVQVTAGPTIAPSATPSQSPEPTIAAALAIATDIEVIGESAAFSADGTWFAFTARPTDASAGPNVFVWRVGDEQARPLTADGATYFASWSGGDLLASRPARADDATTDAVTVRIDPETGDERAAGELWRPIVDPTGTLAIGWTGSISDAESDGTWIPATGNLGLRRWSDTGVDHDQVHRRDQLVTDEAAGDFDIRWDETGEWVAAWVADAHDPTIGRLTLYQVDTEGTRLEQVDGAPLEVPALPGFSIGNGRLAWATPPGQDGEGSRIQIAAWSAGDIGTVESTPGEGIVVVR